jgi:hypothetical protein
MSRAWRVTVAVLVVVLLLSVGYVMVRWGDIWECSDTEDEPLHAPFDPDCYLE